MLYTGTGQYQILQVRLVRVPADDACMTVCDTQLVPGTVPVYPTWSTRSRSCTQKHIKNAVLVDLAAGRFYLSS
eukprot:SAG11_NODE_39812_length_220_cov_27.818182_1_plen_73_part_11